MTGERRHHSAMLCRRQRIRKALVRRHHPGTVSLRQRQIHKILDRPLERQRETNRIRTHRFIFAPTNGQFRYGGHQNSGLIAFDLA